jgi:hypothetical protein
LSELFHPADFKGTPYTGVLLDEESRDKLRALAPEGWKFLGHHMVLNMGPLDTKLNRPANLGRRYKMVAHLLAGNDKVLAVGVWSPLKTSNLRAHITVAVNRTKDGKASDAGGLIGWTKLRPTIELWGTVFEFGKPRAKKEAGVRPPRARHLSNAELFGPINPDSPFKGLRELLRTRGEASAQASTR